jgi:hypothetical protein
MEGHPKILRKIILMATPTRSIRLMERQKAIQNEWGRIRGRCTHVPSSIHNNAHPMQDCKVLIAQAKKMKGMYEAAGPEGCRNQKQKRELNTIDNLDKLVANAVKSRVKQCNKKAKFEKKKRDDECLSDHLLLSSLRAHPNKRINNTKELVPEHPLR